MMKLETSLSSACNIMYLGLRLRQCLDLSMGNEDISKETSLPVTLLTSITLNHIYEKRGK